MFLIQNQQADILTGQKIELRVPTTTWASPSKIRFHSITRSGIGALTVQKRNFFPKSILKSCQKLRRK